MATCHEVAYFPCLFQVQRRHLGGIFHCPVFLHTFERWKNERIDKSPSAETAEREREVVAHPRTDRHTFMEILSTTGTHS
jgi:hypothetical protein